MTPVEAISERIAKIQSELEERQSEARAAQMRVLLLESALANWNEALDVVLKATPNAVDGAASTPPATAPPTARASRPVRQGRRGPKGVWKSVMNELRNRVSTSVFGVDDAVAAGVAVGHTLNRDTTRGQMASYVNSGMLIRVEDGRFRFAEDQPYASQERVELTADPADQETSEV